MAPFVVSTIPSIHVRQIPAQRHARHHQPGTALEFFGVFVQVALVDAGDVDHGVGVGFFRSVLQGGQRRLQHPEAGVLVGFVGAVGLQSCGWLLTVRVCPVLAVCRPDRTSHCRRAGRHESHPTPPSRTACTSGWSRGWRWVGAGKGGGDQGFHLHGHLLDGEREQRVFDQWGLAVLAGVARWPARRSVGAVRKGVQAMRGLGSLHFR